jgi:hypothetical protein
MAIIFSPKRFYAEHFRTLSHRQIFYLSFFGILMGLLFGSLFTGLLSNYVLLDFTQEKEAYAASLKNLGLTEEFFLEVLATQRAYALILLLLSPLIGYMAPHLFGGALYVFFWLFLPKAKVSYQGMMECAAISLVSVFLYCLPVVGPLLALIMVGINVARAIGIQFQLSGWLKGFAIISALYVCIFLSSTTLQMLAIPLGRLLK